MGFYPNQECVFTTSSEHEAIMVQDQLIMAGCDALILNKKDSTYGTFGTVEIYVPLLQVEKAKLLIKTLHE